MRKLQPTSQLHAQPTRCSQKETLKVTYFEAVFGAMHASAFRGEREKQFISSASELDTSSFGIFFCFPQSPAK